jgi:hypothetical protein
VIPEEEGAYSVYVQEIWLKPDMTYREGRAAL